MHLLLLHGATGASDQLLPLAEVLSKGFVVHTLDFSGHGKRVMPEQPYSISLFAEDVLAYLDENGLDSVSVFGFSMGGYVAMYLAKHYPQHIHHVITLATKFYWDKSTAAKEIQMVNPDKIQEKIPAFAATLEQRHLPNDWKEVLKRTAAMMTALGEQNALQPEDYTSIEAPSLLLLGDRDKMVTTDETFTVFRNLPNAQMGMLPGTAHPVEQVDITLLAYHIRRFCTY
jgi:pimeloyl-ACP methyl ester carboxylesterase